MGALKAVPRWVVVSAAALAVIAALAFSFLIHEFRRQGPNQGAVVVVVPKGLGVSAIGRLLERRGVLRSALVFALGVRYSGHAGDLRAGEYEFPAGASPHAVMELLRSGHTVVRRLTIPEGLTTPQVMALVDAAQGLEGAPGAMPEEGALLPDTYHYSYGDSRAGMIARMERAMTETVEALWRARSPHLPLASMREARILASVVEKETGIDGERGRIAAVFYNRLRRGMPLQSDPTVAYGVARAEGRPERTLDRVLTRKDLAAPNPYNTYLNRGLPPGPIANPGRAALAAVTAPAATDALYFVADGSGGHVFARTLAEHNRNVRRWRRIHDRHGAAPAPAGAKDPGR